jgi:hypothetical protein
MATEQNWGTALPGKDVPCNICGTAGDPLASSFELVTALMRVVLQEFIEVIGVRRGSSQKEYFQICAQVECGKKCPEIRTNQFQKEWLLFALGEIAGGSRRPGREIEMNSSPVFIADIEELQRCFPFVEPWMRFARSFSGKIIHTAISKRLMV